MATADRQHHPKRPFTPHLYQYWGLCTRYPSCNGSSSVRLLPRDTFPGFKRLVESWLCF